MGLADEDDRTGRDAAARWLLKNERQPAAKTPKKKQKRPQLRREDKRHGPPDGRSGLIIYTDGACEPNPGNGGWGFVVYDAGKEIHAAHGGSVSSTNNIMEMTGLKMALEWIAERGVQATVISDSQYVVKGCNEWRHGWKSRGWRRIIDRKSVKLEPIKNAELWKEIDALLQPATATIEWCKGHSGIRGNERADELSVMGRRHATEQARILRGLEGQLHYVV